MNIQELFNKNNIDFKIYGDYLSTYCPFCNKSYAGYETATLNINTTTGYANCSACKGNFEWQEITDKLGINISIKPLINKKDFNSKIISARIVKSKALIKCFDDIKSVPIDWLWEGRIAFGKLTMIVGDPGLGKSLITIALATYVSKGFPFPVDNSKCPIGDVILISAEDDPADTIKPRLEAMEADCSRIHIIEAIQEEDTKNEITERMFSFERDIKTLEELLSNQPNCRLVVIDPVSAYLGSADSNKNSDIRRLLAPLSKLAEKFKVAIVLISHLNKNSGEGNVMYRTTGSLAFIATARSNYIVVKDKDNPERILFMPLKNNISKVKTGLAYSIIEADNKAPIIAWETEPITMTVEEAFTLPKSKEECGAVDEATDFLCDLLANGSIKATDVKEEAREIGISKKSLEKACKRLNIKPQKIGFNPTHWIWSLPEDSPNNEDTPS